MVRQRRGDASARQGRENDPAARLNLKELDDLILFRANSFITAAFSAVFHALVVIALSCPPAHHRSPPMPGGRARNKAEGTGERGPLAAPSAAAAAGGRALEPNARRPDAPQRAPLANASACAEEKRG